MFVNAALNKHSSLLQADCAHAQLTATAATTAVSGCAVVCKTPRKEDNADLLFDECMLEGAPLIMRCNTMPVQQAEAMEQLLRQVRRLAACEVIPRCCASVCAEQLLNYDG